ncbi:MAG TPA: murein biosynthesis integral membrane protein MurJ [Pyrinomonadaceae bacterium]|jgi:putative peptidoglycan lipid II flippase|nr:murein biosynthesis integral membrane protein MurJ [Pyrinomonadaceae bacterium]
MTQEPEDNPTAGDAPKDDKREPPAPSPASGQRETSDQNRRDAHVVETRFEEASTVAGETQSPVGAATGQFPAERVVAKRERETGAGKYALLVGAGILLSRIVGLIRQRVFAYYFGNSFAKDAFDAAFRIPNFLQNAFGEGALSASFIPVYANLLARGDEDEADHVAGAVFTLLALVTSVLVLGGVLATPFLINIIAPGFEGARQELTLRLVRIFFPGAGLLVLSAWCLGVLNSHRRFFLSYTAPIIWNFAIIAALVGFGGWQSGGQMLSEEFGARLALMAAWGSVVGSALQFAVQLPTVFSLIKRLRLTFDFASTHLRTVVRNFLPVFVSRGVIQISAFVDQLLASYLPIGAVSALTFAQSIYTLPVSLFGMSVSAAELPAMSSAMGSIEEVAEQLRRRLDGGLRQIAFFIVPSAMAFVALGDIIVGVLYRTGRFTDSDVLYVWGIIAGSATGLLASTLGRLYSSTYYALHDTRTPLRYAVLRIVVSISLGILLALYLPPALGIDPRWGVAGLTVASGMAGWVEFFLLRRTLNRRIGRTGLSFAYISKLWLAAFLSAAIAWGIKLLVGRRHPFLLAALVLIPYGLLYFAITTLFKLPEARTVVGRFTRFLPFGRR